MKYLALLLLMTACGGRPEIQDEFYPVVNMILMDAASRDKAFTITSDIVFGNADSGAFSTCRRRPGSKQIIVDKNEWDKARFDQRYWVIAHELGHCEFALQHDDSVDENGLPSHVMNTMAHDVELAVMIHPEKKDHYLDQLFMYLF